MAEKLWDLRVSLHIPAVKDITPVRYVVETEYISQEVLDKEDRWMSKRYWKLDSRSRTDVLFLLDDR